MSQNVDVNSDGFLGTGDTLRGVAGISMIDDPSTGEARVVGSGDNNQLTAIFEIEVIDFALVSDPDNSCGGQLEYSSGTRTTPSPPERLFSSRLMDSQRMHGR